MGEKVLTVFWGEKGASIVTADFQFGDIYHGAVKFTDYPMNPLKALVYRKRVNAMYFGNGVQANVPYDDKPLLDPFDNEFKNAKVRLIFTDILGNPDIKNGSQVPAIVEVTRQLENQKRITEEITTQLLETFEHYGFKMKDDRTRQLLEDLRISKEAKKYLFSVLDLQNRNFQSGGI